jgi:molybdopterin molybdotransferase
VSGDLLSVEAAQATVLAGVGPLDDLDHLDPELALGRVLAEPVVAATALPPWDNSAMDGYAIRFADVARASDGRSARASRLTSRSSMARPSASRPVRRSRAARTRWCRWS